MKLLLNTLTFGSLLATNVFAAPAAGPVSETNTPINKKSPALEVRYVQTSAKALDKRYTFPVAICLGKDGFGGCSIVQFTDSTPCSNIARAIGYVNAVNPQVKCILYYGQECAGPVVGPFSGPINLPLQVFGSMKCWI
ncbi:hypothetical protein TWF730_001648 [Orbilia blumenaviensis]|uniref:Uncharacterized protein n=1 Tax=Orbilia blumenaviensis TaxID=1796055 RepID=A0AAV9ULE6_9PEZI